MRLYVLELKRLLKTRSVGILIIAALILSAVLSYLPVTYIQAYKTDKSGTIQVVTGIEAIKAKKADKKALHGEMTEAKIRETIADIKEVLKEYGSLERQNIPLDVYVKKVYSHLDIIAVLEQTIIPNGKNLYTLEYSDISEDDAKNVYTAYRENVQNLNKNPEVQKKINQMTKHIQIPLAYYSEFTTDQLDYYQIYLFLVMIFFMVIITPVFATEYQTGSDQILRCTKHGRFRLAITKIAVVFTLIFAVFAVGTTVFSIIMRILYGAEVFKNPLQMLGYLYYIPAFTVGKMYKVMVAGGLLSLVAVGASILFFSAKCKTVQSALICAFAFTSTAIISSIDCICTDCYFYNIKQPEYSGDFKVYLPDQRTCLHEQSGGRIACQKLCTDWQWILLDTIYYCDCGGNLDSGISGHNGG